MKKKLIMFLMSAAIALASANPAFSQSRTHSTAKRFNLTESNVNNFYVIDGVQLPALDFTGYNFFMITGDIKSMDMGNGGYLVDIFVDGQVWLASCNFVPGIIDKLPPDYKRMFVDAGNKLTYRTFPGDGRYRIYLVCELTGVTIIGFQTVK
jgi:hypothetical protein